MVSLLELFLPGIATQKGAAVLINPVAEVLAGHADHASHPTLQLPIINKDPFHHHPSALVQLYYPRLEFFGEALARVRDEGLQDQAKHHTNEGVLITQSLRN